MVQRLVRAQRGRDVDRLGPRVCRQDCRLDGGGGDRLLDEHLTRPGVEGRDGVRDVAGGVGRDDDEVGAGQRCGAGPVVEQDRPGAGVLRRRRRGPDLTVAHRPQGHLGAERAQHAGVPLPDGAGAAHDDVDAHDVLTRPSSP